MNPKTSTRSPASIGRLVLAVIVLALIAYFFWGRHRDAAPPPAAATAADASAAAVQTRPATQGPGGLPAGAHYEGGILVDAQGNRILNEAGLPIGPPIDPAKPVPIKAAPGEVVGYRMDANGVAQPMRAGDIKGAANAPGTYAVVDIWAEGGPAVVPPTQGHHLSAAELAKLRADEAKRDAAGAANP